MRLVRIGRLEADDAIAMTGVEDAVRLGCELDEELPAVEPFLHAAISTEQPQKSGAGHDEGLVLAKPESKELQ